MKTGDIVLVPFPFSDLSSKKVRPALVISNKKFKGNDVICCGITSQEVEQSTILNSSDLSQGELPVTSYIKYGKIITIDRKIIRKTVANISSKKLKEVTQSLNKIIG